LSEDAVSKVFASLALEGRGFSPASRGPRARAGDELVIQEKNEVGKLVRSLSLNREGRLCVLVSLDDRRLRVPLLLLSVYDRIPLQP
jgi:hypothetical protein